MKHRSEGELDRLARSGAGEEDEHVQVCAACREQYRYLVRFHQAMAEVKKLDFDPRLARLAAGKISGRVIQLSRYEPHPDASDLGITEGFIVLAADTQGVDTAPAREERTFASQESRVLLRVVREPAGNRYRLHVLSEDPDVGRYALVGIRYRGDAVYEGATDRDGVSEVTLDQPIEWDEATMTVSTSLLVLQPSSSGEFPSQTNVQELSVHTHRHANRLEIRCGGGGLLPRCAVAITRDGRSMLSRFIDRKTVVEIVPSDPPVELRIFP